MISVADVNQVLTIGSLIEAFNKDGFKSTLEQIAADLETVNATNHSNALRFSELKEMEQKQLDLIEAADDKIKAAESRVASINAAKAAVERDQKTLTEARANFAAESKSIMDNIATLRADIEVRESNCRDMETRLTERLNSLVEREAAVEAKMQSLKSLIA